MSGGISESPAIGIGKLLMEGTFIVPNHQRDYSWTTHEVRQLFDDVEDAIARPSPIYFVGLMVFLNSDTGPRVVLDGQQRLATALIMFSAIRSWLQQYSEYQSDASKIQEWFIGRSELGERDLKPRVTMNAANNQAFTDYVVKAVAIPDIKEALGKLAKQDRNRRLMEAAIYAHDRVASMALRAADPASAARYMFRFVNYLRDNVGVIRLQVSSEEAAYTIFETLNDRGLDLSPLDLVKNHLFGKADAHSKTRVRDLESRWAQMMSTLANVRSDNFLKAFWTSRHGRIRSGGLFEGFKREYADPAKASNLSIELLDAAEQYAALESPDDPIWSQHLPDTRATIRSFKVVGSQQAHPVMLSALAKMDAEQVERLFRMLEICIVRYLLVGGGNPGQFETTCARVARMIYAQEVTTATAAFQEMKELYPPDDEFQAAFAVKQERSNQKAQYFLRRIEMEVMRADQGKMAGEIQPGMVTVEHVLPRNPAAEWTKELQADPDFVDECVFRLGNMCLLPKINKDLGRNSFADKKVAYASSQLRLAQRIAEFEVWNKENVQLQQTWMAKHAVATWRFQ